MTSQQLKEKKRIKLTIDKILDYEDGKLNETEEIGLFQELINSGLAWQLQGSYGRTAEVLIQKGLCEG